MQSVSFFTTLVALSLLLLSSSTASPAGQISAGVQVISGQPFNGPSTVQFKSDSSGFDGPKIKNLNSTVFDLWYFDTISSDLKSSAVASFFTAENTALFPGLPDLGTAVWMEVEVAMPDGTVFATIIPASQLTVTTIDNGSSGLFAGGGAAWVGAPDMSRYIVTINAPAQGITGTITLNSVAPAHFPCGPATGGAGQSFQLTSKSALGWFNAVPDANGEVNLNVSGTHVQFSGPGYHDKNWGEQPWDTTLRSWYWGRARVGPYSVVWFDSILPDGTEATSGYVAQNGRILAAACGSAVVRPTGQNAVYPPTSSSPLPDGFAISIPVPGQGTLQLTAQNQQAIDHADGLTTRWRGTLTGGFAGKQQYSGIGLYEQYTFV